MHDRIQALFLAGLVAAAGASAQPPAPPAPPRPAHGAHPPRPPKDDRDDDERKAGSRGAQTLNEKRSFVAKGVIEIDNARGSIRVSGWDQTDIQVTGSLGAGAEGLEISVTGERASISVEARNPHGVSSDLEIKVPAGSELEIDAFAAETTVSGVSGTVRVDSVDAGIHVSGGSRELELQTVNGAIEVTGDHPGGRVHVEAVNGAVTLRGVGGDVEASTVNGRLTVEAGSLQRARFETVSGALAVQGDLAKGARLDIETVSGTVELTLPASVSARFEVTSFSGDIKNELSADQARRAGRYTSEQNLSFETGSAGATVDVQTLSGDVVLRKR